MTPLRELYELYRYPDVAKEANYKKALDDQSAIPRKKIVTLLLGREYRQVPRESVDLLLIVFQIGVTC